MTGLAALALALPLTWFYFSLSSPLSRISETPAPEKSTSLVWWLNSGAYARLSPTSGLTLQGDLSPADPWFGRYRDANPVDSDGGAHPQNIFRLITRDLFTGFSQSAYFKIRRTHLSPSPERGEFSGVFLFTRYSDSDNLYYAGLRHDGAAVIKKKLHGRYSTLAATPVYPGLYHRDSSPNLLPQNTWIGLKTLTATLPDGSVILTLYLDDDGTGDWDRILQTQDSLPPAPTGHAGIRSDFMDLEFTGYFSRSQLQ